MSSGYVVVDDVSLPYWVKGEGTPCIVVSDPSYQRKALSGMLRRKFRFIFTETRVFHVHDHPVSYENVTVDTLVEDIEAVRRHLNLDKVVLLGHSIAGLFALEYAKKYPGETTHLMMLNTPPQLEYWSTIETYWENNASEERMKEYRKRSEELEKKRDRLTPEELSLLEMTLDAPLRWFDLSFDPSYLYEGYRLNNDGYGHIMSLMVDNYDVRDNTPVNVPVFMSQSIHDYIVPFKLWEKYQYVFTDLTLHLFEKSGHTPQLEEQELFDRLLIEWYENHLL